MYETIVENLNRSLLASQAAVEQYAVSANPNRTVLARLASLRDLAEREYNSFLGFATMPEAKAS